MPPPAEWIAAKLAGLEARTMKLAEHELVAAWQSAGPKRWVWQDADIPHINGKWHAYLDDVLYLWETPRFQ